MDHYPPGMRVKSGVEVFRHQGCKMVATWARPTAERPRFPAVLFLHGFPGSEKNVDIQRALLKRGVGSLALNFRGAWGSEGVYTFSGLLADARAGLRRMRAMPGVDPRRLAVFGFSMGGWTALNLAAEEPSLRAAVAIAPVGGPEMIGPDGRKHVAWLSKALKIRSIESLHRDFEVAVRRWDPALSVTRRKCPLLLVHGERDELVPTDVSRRLHAIACAPKRLVTIPGGFHDCLEQRDQVVRTVSRWLLPHLGVRAG